MKIENHLNFNYRRDIPECPGELTASELKLGTWALELFNHIPPLRVHSRPFAVVDQAPNRRPGILPPQRQRRDPYQRGAAPWKSHPIKVDQAPRECPSPSHLLQLKWAFQMVQDIYSWRVMSNVTGAFQHEE